MQGEVIRPSDVHAPRGYNHAIRAGDTVYVAGQVALDPRGQLVGKGDITAQAD
jgi:enamine deaminase RidA (YjgF/YER057c/UK114 family)